MNDRKQTVLVTGASGYLSGWMIAGLLDRGYDVRATLRRPEAAVAVRAAVADQGISTDRLTFKTADLLSDSGWDEAIHGCDAVMHVASPMGQGQGRKIDLLTPAREGTMRVLRAAERGGVKRVVMTSSAIAAQRNQSGAGDTASEDEAVWTNIEQKNTSNYARSKALAERAAWDFVETKPRSLTLTTILPGMILGPVMSDKAAGSVDVISRMLTGKMPAIPRIGFGVVDVRDLVELHILAMQSPTASGQRFLAVSDFLWLSDMAVVLKDALGPEASRVPSRMLPDFVLRIAALFQEQARFMAPKIGKSSSLSSRKATEWLGWHPRPATETVIDCAQSLIAQHIV